MCVCGSVCEFVMGVCVRRYDKNRANYNAGYAEMRFDYVIEASRRGEEKKRLPFQKGRRKRESGYPSCVIIAQ